MGVLTQLAGARMRLPLVTVDAALRGNVCAERAPDPLHRTRIDSEPSRDLADALSAARRL